MMRGILVWRWLRLALATLLVTVSLSVRADDLAKEVKQLADGMLDSNRTASLAIAIDRGGKMLLDEGYGFADIEKKERATPGTVYRIGSITKQFTGVAIVQLKTAGKLKLDDEIQTIITEYPAPPKPVTVRNLLQHTSGIPSFTDLPSYLPKMPEDVTHADMIARFDTLPLSFDPGTQWHYNNSGYYLLGMIVEKASGQTYSDYLEQNLFGPAGMTQTDYETPMTVRSEGYRRNGDKLVVAGPLSMTQPFSAGSLDSTAGDLVKWMRALVDGKLSPPDAFAQITGDVYPTGDAGEGYGYGIGVSVDEGRKIISHGGGINGFASMLAYYPETDHTISILANTEGFNCGALMRRIIDLLDPAKTGGAGKDGD